ncbi:hypothetical protein ACO0LG_08305 [Undibacterium sp. Ji42W]|uniref:hypothetical protein n=1 Tax=Undibacterium sp. Ji42W TaxID=3413039 RepID=UPI003BF25D21
MVNIDEYKIVFELISKKDSRMNWYNLEIALSRQGFGGSINALQILERLLSEGLLETISNQQLPYPIYKITDAGRARLCTSAA